MPDGDRLAVHDDCPTAWSAGGPVALLVHGLGGCHQSGYMRRIAGKLNDRGVRVMRLDLRGCGAGMTLARYPYHAGQTGDVAAVLAMIASVCPGSPVVVVGFSLGGNIVLKFLGECGTETPGHVAGALAVCPPVDLAACISYLERPQNRLYEWHFMRTLHSHMKRRMALVDAVGVPNWKSPPRSLRVFDDEYTSRVSGFEDGADYYRRASAGPSLHRISVPTLVLASRDDPLVPVTSCAQAHLSDSTSLHLTGGGGHVGFLGAAAGEPDRWWMDWRVVDWVTSQTA